MPLQTTAYTSGQLSTRRQGLIAQTLYVANRTNRVVFQFQPSADATGTDNTQITYSSTVSGAYTNCLQWQTVIVHPTSNVESDLINDYKACLITYVRKAPTSTILYIGKTGYQWTTSHYVTVLNDFRPHHKPQSVSNDGTQYKDYNIDEDRGFRLPPPRISGYYPAVLYTTGSSANFSPTPTATAMAPTATISSYSWSMIADDGTTTKAVTTGATPTISLGLGWNWVYLEVTDSYGGTAQMAVPVVVAKTNYNDSGAYLQGAIQSASKTLSRDGGATCDVVLLQDNSEFLPGSPMLITYRDSYTDGTINQGVWFYGWTNSRDDNNRADNQTGISRDTRLTIQHISTVMQQFKLDAMETVQENQPQAWGELSRLSMMDCVWYAISEHTTCHNVASFAFFSGAENYQYPRRQIPSGDYWSACNELMLFCSARPNITNEGEVIYSRDLNLETDSSARTGATVLWTIDQRDADTYQITKVDPNLLTQAFGGVGSYNEFSRQLAIAAMLAPADWKAASFRITINGLVLTKNLTGSTLESTAGSAVYNRWADGNELERIRFTVLPGYHLQVPQVGAWVQISATASQTLSGTAFGSSINLQITDVQVSAQAGQKHQVGITLRRESGGDSDYSQMPQIITTNPDDQNWDDAPTGAGGWEDTGEDITSNEPPTSGVFVPNPQVPPTERPTLPPPPNDGERLFVKMNASTTVQTDGNLVAGETYRVYIYECWGVITPADSTAVVSVPATSTAYNTGVAVDASTPLTIKAVGQWSYGTDSTIDAPVQSDLDGWTALLANFPTSTNPFTTNGTYDSIPYTETFILEKVFDSVQTDIDSITFKYRGDIGANAPGPTSYFKVQLYANGTEVYTHTKQPISSGNNTDTLDVSAIAKWDTVRVTCKATDSTPPGGSARTGLNTGNQAEFAIFYRTDYVTADGIGTAPAGYTLPGGLQYGLIGKIGAGGSWFDVGANYNNPTPGTTDTLYLAINDDTTAYANNSGSLTATIKINYDRYGDAVSYWDTPDGLQTAYAATKGLTFNGVTIPPAANLSHAYAFQYTASTSEDGSPLSVTFVDPDSDYTDNSDRTFIIDIAGVFA